MDQKNSQNFESADKNAGTGATRIKRKQMKQIARNFTNNSWGRSADDFPDFGKPLMTLVEEFKSGTAGLKKELTDMKKAFKQQKEAPPNRLMDAAFFNKAGFYPTKNNLIYLGTLTGVFQNGKWVSGFSAQKMKELVLLDDIPSWLKTGISAIAKTGMNALNTVMPMTSPLTHMAGNALDKWVDSDTGIFQADQSNKIPTKLAQITPIVNGQPIEIDKTLFDPSRVDVNSLMYVLGADTNKKGIARFDDVQPGALFQAFYEIPIVPGSSGQGVFQINCAELVGTTNGMFITYSGSTTDLNLSTGAYTTGMTTIQTPATPSTVAALRRVSTVITYKSTVPVNTTYANGRIDLWHDPGLVDTTSNYASPCAYYTLTNVGSRPFYQCGGVTSDYTQLYYNPLDQVPYVGNVGGTQIKAPIILVLSGANTSGIQVGVVTVHVVWNVLPSPSGMGSLVIQNPGIGPFTPDLMDAIYQLCPQLFIADQKTRLEIFKGLAAIKPLYANVLEYLVGLTWTRNFSKGGTAMQY